MVYPPWNQQFAPEKMLGPKRKRSSSTIFRCSARPVRHCITEFFSGTFLGTMRDIPHQGTVQGFFSFPPGGIWTRSFAVSTGDHPFWSRLTVRWWCSSSSHRDWGMGDGDSLMRWKKSDRKSMRHIYHTNRCIISSINSISRWWMTHNDTIRRQINVWCFCCTKQGGVCCDEHVRLPDNKFSKSKWRNEQLVGVGATRKVWLFEESVYWNLCDTWCIYGLTWVLSS